MPPPVTLLLSGPYSARIRYWQTFYMAKERAEVIVIGAGIVGAMAAFYSAKSGFKTIVIDRGAFASGTTGAG